MPLRRLLDAIRSYCKRPVVRNLAVLLFCTGVSQLCNLGVLLLTAQHLGKEATGVFLFALTIQNYLLQLGTVGAGQPLVRAVTAHPERSDEFISAYLALLLSSTTLVTACAFAGLALAAPTAGETQMWIWLLTGNMVASLYLLPLFDAHHRQGRAALVAVLVDLLALAGFLLSAFSGQLDIGRAGQLMAGKWILLTAAHLIVFVGTVRPFRWMYRSATLRLFLASGLRVLIAFLLLLAPLNGGIVLVRLFCDEAETAIVGIASQMATVHLLFCLQVARIVQPHITGPHGLEPSFVRKVVLAFGSITFALTLGSAVAGVAIILWLPGYAASLVPLVLLLLGSLLLSWGFIESLYLHRAHREWEILLCYLAGGAVWLGVACWLVPAWGALGAGAAVLVASGVSGGLMSLCLIRGAGSRSGLLKNEARHPESPETPG